jgi:hypothetical protein
VSAVAAVVGGLCIGQPNLFGSTNPADHEKAKKICAVCPALAACAQALDEVRRSGAVAAPEGTWAGQFLNNADKRHARAYAAWRRTAS